MIPLVIPILASIALASTLSAGEAGSGTELTADSLPRIRIPADPAVYVKEKPLEQVLADYRAGDSKTVALVRGTLRKAEQWARKSDEWYRDLFPDFEPRGRYTLACPIHPFKTQFHNDFQWSIDEPWKLICIHCKAEGRRHFYYPNPDYPDDGQGCAPTDEVWARDHDEAWSKAHRGIAHGHWDGATHAYLPSKRYYFRGHCYEKILRILESKVAQDLSLAYQLASKAFAEGSDEHERAETYAHKAQVILLCCARAYLGDDYLAAAERITPERFRERMESFCRSSSGARWTYRKHPGFRPFHSHNEVAVGDPLYERELQANPSGGYRVYPGSWTWRADKACHLLEAFCRVRAAFATGNDDIRRMCQRPIVSFPEDKTNVSMGQDPSKHVLKRGVFEMEIHPYSLESCGDNMAHRTQLPRLRAGLLLRDDAIIENVARDIMYFWKNQFSQDGLGREGSPTYSPYGITRIMDMMYGIRGDFDQSAPYFDKKLGGINMAKIPEYQACAVKMMYYVTDDDDHYIPWEDSNYGAKRTTRHLETIERFGDGIPEKHRKYLDIRNNPGGDVSISFSRSHVLPPVLLHDRRKAILRAGKSCAPTVVSLDFTKACGHYHSAAQALTIHACGQELASDLGYMGSAHFLTTKWIRTYAAHNCLTLRREDGSPDGTGRLRGDLRKHFVRSPFCQVVDTAEYDSGDWRDAGEASVGEFGRQIILMAPSEEHQYVIDIARARGGHTHDYYLHCHGLAFDTEGMQLHEVPDPEQDLYELSGWRFACSEGSRARNIKRLAHGKSTGPWQATWSRIDDYRGQPQGQPLTHDDVFMRLWMADEPGSEVIVGTAPAQRYIRLNDFGRTMKVLCVRRPNTESVDCFVGVMEPYRNEPFVKNVRRLEIDALDGYTVAVAVDTVHGTDYVISYGGPARPQELTVQDSGHTIRTDADLAVVSFPASGPPRLLLAGGRFLEADDRDLTTDDPPEWRGRLLDFNDAADTLEVEAPDGLPAGSQLAGRTLVVQHAEDRSTFTISSVVALGQDRYTIHLDDEPHLANNWFLVREVDGEGIVVEPPPVLDMKTRNYKVYAGRPGKLRMIGPLKEFGSKRIHSEAGLLMHSLERIVTDNMDRVRPGEELAITRLEKGRDTFSVSNLVISCTP